MGGSEQRSLPRSTREIFPGPLFAWSLLRSPDASDELRQTQPPPHPTVIAQKTTVEVVFLRASRTAPTQVRIVNQLGGEAQSATYPAASSSDAHCLGSCWVVAQGFRGDAQRSMIFAPTIDKTDSPPLGCPSLRIAGMAWSATTSLASHLGIPISVDRGFGNGADIFTLLCIFPPFPRLVPLAQPRAAKSWTTARCKPAESGSGREEANSLKCR